MLDPAGGAACDCPDGKERFLGSCEILYTQSVCGEGEFLLPENFNLGNKICPDKFSAKLDQNCLAYGERGQHLSAKGTNSFKIEIAFLKGLISNKKSRTICCPEENTNSFLSPELLIKSMINSKPTCVKNPCPPEMWPWASEDNFSKCLEIDESIKTCDVQLIEEENVLVCRFYDIRSVSPRFRRGCPRRKRFIHGRCVRVF